MIAYTSGAAVAIMLALYVLYRLRTLHRECEHGDYRRLDAARDERQERIAALQRETGKALDDLRLEDR